MGKRVIQIAANLIILLSFFMLGRVWCRVASGVQVKQYFGTSPESWVPTVYALGLSLPLPLHIISVGLVLQLPWLSPRWAKGARWAVVISGCWLGLALAIRWLAL